MNLRRIARHLGIHHCTVSLWVDASAATLPAIQELADDAPKAKHHYSDAFDAYDRLWYHFGSYQVSEGKTDTYSVEGDNAELRHYLARLARSSR